MMAEAEAGLHLPAQGDKEWQHGRTLPWSSRESLVLPHLDFRPQVPELRAQVAAVGHGRVVFCHSSLGELISYHERFRTCCFSQCSVKLLASSHSYQGPFRKVCTRSNSCLVKGSLTIPMRLSGDSLGICAVVPTSGLQVSARRGHRAQGTSGVEKRVSGKLLPLSVLDPKPSRLQEPFQFQARAVKVGTEEDGSSYEGKYHHRDPHGASLCRVPAELGTSPQQPLRRVGDTCRSPNQRSRATS